VLQKRDRGAFLRKSARTAELEAGDSLDMMFSTRSRLRRAASLIAIGSAVAVLAACATPQPKSMVHKKPRSKEYFSEKEFGVKGSPYAKRMVRGGGRDQIGKPYVVRGKRYVPREDKNYKKVGMASWYGDAFHGRLTANGEVYDKTHLTAAHPTMPLPSYARVTNMDNGSSVIVRVNDRGPYSHGRLIDLSQRAAQMLDYASAGTAKVKVEYVGRAPLDGKDESYLMASYRPGNASPDPSDGLPTGVMVAMNGPTPSVASDAPTAVPFPGVLDDQQVAEAAAPADAGAVMTATVAMPGDLALPDFGPIVPERPAFDPALQGQLAMAAMSYAQERVVGAANNPFGAYSGGLTADAVTASWKRGRVAAAPSETAEAFVAAASFDSRSDAEALRERLSAYGRAVLDMTNDGGSPLYGVSIYADGRMPIDSILEAAWSHGAPDAIVVRD